MKKLTLLFLSIMFILIFLQGCGGGDSSAVVPTPTVNPAVSGSIVDPSNSNQPVTLQVNLSANSGSTAVATDGTFRFSFSANSFYIISSSSDAYEGSLTGGYVAGSDINGDIPLTQGRPLVRYINN